MLIDYYYLQWKINISYKFTKIKLTYMEYWKEEESGTSR